MFKTLSVATALALSLNATNLIVYIDNGGLKSISKAEFIVNNGGSETVLTMDDINFSNTSPFAVDRIKEISEQKQNVVIYTGEKNLDSFFYRGFGEKFNINNFVNYIIDSEVKKTRLSARSLVKFLKNFDYENLIYVSDNEIHKKIRSRGHFSSFLNAYIKILKREGYISSREEKRLTMIGSIVDEIISMAKKIKNKRSFDLTKNGKGKEYSISDSSWSLLMEKPIALYSMSEEEIAKAKADYEQNRIDYAYYKQVMYNYFMFGGLADSSSSGAVSLLQEMGAIELRYLDERIPPSEYSNDSRTLDGKMATLLNEIARQEKINYKRYTERNSAKVFFESSKEYTIKEPLLVSKMGPRVLSFDKMLEHVNPIGNEEQDMTKLMGQYFLYSNRAQGLLTSMSGYLDTLAMDFAHKRENGTLEERCAEDEPEIIEEINENNNNNNIGAQLKSSREKTLLDKLKTKPCAEDLEASRVGVSFWDGTAKKDVMRSTYEQPQVFRVNPEMYHTRQFITGKSQKTGVWADVSLGGSQLYALASVSARFGHVQDLGSDEFWNKENFRTDLYNPRFLGGKTHASDSDIDGMFGLNFTRNKSSLHGNYTTGISNDSVTLPSGLKMHADFNSNIAKYVHFVGLKWSAFPMPEEVAEELVSLNWDASTVDPALFSKSTTLIQKGEEAFRMGLLNPNDEFWVNRSLDPTFPIEAAFSMGATAFPRMSFNDGLVFDLNRDLADEELNRLFFHTKAEDGKLSSKSKVIQDYFDATIFDPIFDPQVDVNSRNAGDYVYAEAHNDIIPMVKKHNKEILGNMYKSIKETSLYNSKLTFVDLNGEVFLRVDKPFSPLLYKYFFTNDDLTYLYINKKQEKTDSESEEDVNNGENANSRQKRENEILEKMEIEPIDYSGITGDTVGGINTFLITKEERAKMCSDEMTAKLSTYNSELSNDVTVAKLKELQHDIAPELKALSKFNINAGKFVLSNYMITDNVIKNKIKTTVNKSVTVAVISKSNKLNVLTNILVPVDQHMTK